ncbi:hypothetical protein DKT69_34905 [Micromonospora sicca]|uniref:Uncharacterized protein n=2 Tax=Micromonospora sicca TaxID=2202420 RepID=A0A317CXL1_9ACTN|nr:hypothetical protein DKT69_34905 [Micromonospora sp. 4G51]
MEIRAQQASTGVPYLEAMRQALSPTTAPTPAPVSPQVELRPPLAAWRRPVYCRYWADLIARHGELIALTISDGDGWWGLDDLARGVAGALQERPAGERGAWIGIGGGYKATKREHLAGIAAALDGADALRRLTVRVLPDPAVCEHPSCRRRRGEPPIEKTGAGDPPARPAAPRGVMTLGPSLSLAEVMEAHPTLGYAGFRVFDSRLSREERDQQLHFQPGAFA